MDQAAVNAGAAVASAIAAAGSLAVACVAAYAAHVSARSSARIARQALKTAQLELFRGFQETWLSVDQCCLENPDVLPLVMRLTGHAELDSQAARKRIVAFILLNPFRSFYLAEKAGLVDKATSAKMKQSLEPMLRDNYVFEMTQRETFVPGFAEWCKASRGISTP